jgi:hypothetical protein
MMMDDVMVNRDRAQVRTVHIDQLPSYKTRTSTAAAAALYLYEVVVVISHLLPLPLPALLRDVEQVITTMAIGIGRHSHEYEWACRHGAWYVDVVWLIPLRLAVRPVVKLSIL